MRTEEQKKAYYEQLAYDYAGQAVLGRYRASVHLENKDDEWFWNNMLQKYRPGKYNFIYHSRNHKGTDTAGCTQCMAFRDYLSDKFFVCIDSDYRYLCQENGIDAEHFIMQTYTYSWENHCCYAAALQERFMVSAAAIAVHDFNFCLFLEAYSKVVYKPLLWFLFLRRRGINCFTQKMFNNILALQYKHGDFENNGENMILRLKQSADSVCQQLEVKHSTFDFEAEKRFYETLGVTETNAYLHIRGHNLYDLLLSIGNKLAKNFKKDMLMGNLAFDRYDEIQRVTKDIQAL